jgi:hypothetical protein
MTDSDPTPMMTQHVLPRLNRHVGLVPLFRDNTLRYGLAASTRPLYEYHA